MSGNVEMIAEGVQRLLAGHMRPALLEQSEQGEWAAGLWTALEDAGYTRVLLPEPEGGTGGGWVDAYPVLYAAGHSCVPLPLADTLVANGLLARAGLPVEDGPCALLQQLPNGGLELLLDGNALKISGRARNVPWAGRASRIVIAGRAGSQAVIGVVDAGAPGLEIAGSRSIAGEPSGALSFADCICSCFARVNGRLAEQPVLACGALARAAQMSGALEWVLVQTVTHARDREQFGRPLIALQAVKQSLAVLACEAVAADVAVRAACGTSDPLGHRFEVGVAKVRAGKAAGIAARIAHQLHGAMGFTYEHTLHHATRRLWSWRAEFGNEARWAQELGRSAIGRGGAAFWSDLTRRLAGAEPVSLR